jgi:hypothetical protein
MQQALRATQIVSPPGSRDSSRFGVTYTSATFIEPIYSVSQLACFGALLRS